MTYRTANAAKALALAFAVAAGLGAQSTTTTTSTETKPAEGKAIQSGLQVTGTVITSEANRLIVKGDNGQQMTFIVNEQTTDPKLFHPGDRVTASYVTLAGTGPVVTRVESYPAAETTTSTGTVIYPPAAPVPSATAKVEVTPPTASATTTMSNKSTTTTTTYETPKAETTVAANEDLPATASPLPLVALFGFLAAASAGALRFGRKSES